MVRFGIATTGFPSGGIIIIRFIVTFILRFINIEAPFWTSVAADYLLFMDYWLFV